MGSARCRDVNSGIVGLGLCFAPDLPRHEAFSTAMRFVAPRAARSSENLGAFFRCLLMVGRHFGTILFAFVCGSSELKHRGSAEHTSLLCLVGFVFTTSWQSGLACSHAAAC